MTAMAKEAVMSGKEESDLLEEKLTLCVKEMNTKVKNND